MNPLVFASLQRIEVTVATLNHLYPILRKGGYSDLLAYGPLSEDDLNGNRVPIYAPNGVPVQYRFPTNSLQLLEYDGTEDPI